MYIMLLIYPTLLIFISLYGCSVAKKADFESDFWDKNQAKMLQASACIGVILHHLAQLITNYGAIKKGPITLFSSMGILFTSIFFFFSGYGLIVSVNSKTSYLDTFLSHRLTTVLVPFWISNIIYVLVRIFFVGIPMSGKDIVKCVLGYRLLNGNGWYIVEIFFLYIAFFILFKIVRNKNAATLLLCVFACGLIRYSYACKREYTGIGDKWFTGEWWFNSTVVFIMGVLIARFKRPVSDFLKKRYKVIVPIVTVGFIAAFAIEEKILIMYGYYRESPVIDNINSKFVTFVAQSVLCIIFALLILLINMKITIGNRYLKFISSISVELFLIHGIFLHYIFESVEMNDFFMFGAVIVCSIIVAVPIAYFDRFIIDFIGNRVAKVFRKYFGPTVRYILIAIVIAALAVSGVHFLRSSGKCKREQDSIRTAKIGDEVTFGRIQQGSIRFVKRDVEWIVLYKDDNRAMLVAKKGLTGSVYNKKHEKITWYKSDLHALLNDKLYNTVFDKKEKEIILNNPETRDKLSLLSVKEAEEYFDDDKSRELDITERAVLDGTNVNNRSKVHGWDERGYRSSWWWLRGDSADKTAPIVTVDGVISTDKKFVNKPNGAVRPVVWVNIGR